MTEQPTTPAGVHGAVDLSGIGGTAPGPGTLAGTPEPAARRALPPGLHVQATDDTLNDVISRHIGIPGLLVLWSSEFPQTIAFLRDVEGVVLSFGGRVVLVSVDLAANPALLQGMAPMMQQAFGQPSVPATFGLLQGQPVPMFPGVQPPEAITSVIEQLLELAVKNGVAGRVDVGEDFEEELSPLHQLAFDAIEAGDLDGAEAAYQQALEANPKDADAQVGLAQVGLLRRTADADPAASRAAAAADPSDLDAAFVVADLDLLGGHIEDAFGRLLDLVRATSGDERDRARTRLLELFSVVGNQDERVRKGRTALMNALF